ncbi:MAG TPA: alpha/beta fold hydrolase [Candidatus Limnocylindria bacterium]|nr:alpha/beta fold hydrolase [Candidatus Limnocylindria bacterium]
MGDAYGDPAHPPVLLLHGGGQTRHAWGGTAAALAAHGWHAIALDTRGHGDSEWAPDGDYTVDTLAADLRCVVGTLGTRPALVGASLGGITALLAEGEATTPISRALVLVDVAPRVEAPGVHRIVSFMTGHPDGFASLEEAADAIAAYNRHRPRPSDVSGLRKNLRLGPDGRYRWHWDPALMSDKRPGATQNPERQEAAARRLTVPTLLVRGRMSDLLSEAGARAFLALVPHARYADVSGAGHMVAGDRNDAFTRAVVDFLADVP